MRLTFLSSADKILLMTKTAEGGFVFLEMAIGLPLIFMLLWAMSNLFFNTWQNCRNLIADFTLQLEVQNAMQRIVDDLRTARKVEKKQGGVLIQFNLLNGSNIIQNTHPNGNVASGEDDDKEDENTLKGKRQPIIYFSATKSSDKTHPYNWRYIYRQRKLGAKNHPLTGSDALSDVNAKLIVDEIKPHLWSITIEAESGVSGNKFTLKTAVFLEGAADE